MFRSAQKVFASLAPGLRAGLTVDSGSDGSCVDHVLEVSSRKPDGHLGQLVDVNGVVVLDLALKNKRSGWKICETTQRWLPKQGYEVFLHLLFSWAKPGHDHFSCKEILTDTRLTESLSRSNFVEA